MHVGANLPCLRYAVDGADRFPINKNDPLVAYSHFGKIFLDNHRLSVELGEHLTESRQVLIIRLDMKDACTAIAIERLDDYVLEFGPKLLDFCKVGRNQRWRHDAVKMRDKQFLRRVADAHRIIDN